MLRIFPFTYVGDVSCLADVQVVWALRHKWLRRKGALTDVVTTDNGRNAFGH